MKYSHRGSQTKLTQAAKVDTILQLFSFVHGRLPAASTAQRGACSHHPGGALIEKVSALLSSHREVWSGDARPWLYMEETSEI